MIILRFKYLLYSLLFGIIFILPKTVQAQEKKLYSGSLQVANYTGESRYHYNIIDGDTIRNGTFLLQRSNLEALLKQEDISFSIQGNFTNNIPTGNWKFQFNEFQTNQKSTVEDNQYVVNVSGIQRVAQGVLKDGKPDGKWIYTIQHIKDSEIDSVVFKSVINFNNGIPQQNFTIEDEHQELVGMFLRNGVAHDEWTVYSDNIVDAIESWRFDEGVLRDMKIQSGQKTEDITVYPEVLQSTTKMIPLNKAYLEVLKVRLQNGISGTINDSNIMQLLIQNEAHYQNINAILLALGASSFSSKFMVNVPYLPLNISEKEQLDSIGKSYQKSQKISTSLLNNTQLTILKLSDENVRALEDDIAVISEKILRPLEQLTAYYKEDMLPYISREEFLLKIWPDGVSGLGDVLNIDADVMLEKGANTKTLVGVKILADQTLSRLTAIESVLTKKIIKQEREQEAIALEKKMIAQRNYLDQLSDSLRNDTISSVYINTLQNIKKDTEDKLSKYSSIKEVNSKLKYARELVRCFEKLDQVGETIVMLPKQQYTIRSAYKDAVWNPFTATIMIESIKKRLVEAYENVLIPHFLNMVEEGLACEETAQWITLVQTTYDRMLELRDEENTRKLERRLRKENDPQIILQRLGIEPQDKKK